MVSQLIAISGTLSMNQANRIPTDAKNFIFQKFGATFQ